MVMPMAMPVAVAMPKCCFFFDFINVWGMGRGKVQIIIIVFTCFVFGILRVAVLGRDALMQYTCVNASFATLI